MIIESSWATEKPQNFKTLLCLKLFIRRDKAKFVWFPLARRSRRISCKVRTRLFDHQAIWWCQSNANQSPNLQMMRISRRQLTPFGQRGSAIFFEGFAAVEVTFEIEMIVDRGMNGSEFL